VAINTGMDPVAAAPREDYRPSRHRHYKVVLYKQNGRAASTERRVIRNHPLLGLSKNPASPAVLRIEDEGVVRMSAIGEGMPRQRARFDPGQPLRVPLRNIAPAPD
jgi:hypothetical protein